jgi:LysR family transcriptional regulator, nitrogen assimilation regulatory protein
VDLSHWRLLVLLADLGSLSKAAIVLDRPHSVVSRKLSALERECGGALFYRTGRGVVVSELGQQILPRVKALIFEADELAREVRSHAGEVTGRVRIGMVPSVAQALVEPLFAEMKAKFPLVTLSLSEATNGQLGDWISRGEVDLAMLFRDKRNLAPTEEALKVVPAYVIGPPGDPFTTRPQIAFKELDNVPLVLSSQPGQFRLRLDQWAERLGIRLNIAVEADSLAIQKQLVLAKAGYGVLTPLAMAGEMKTGELTAARLVEPEIEFVLALCRTTQRPITTPVRQCINLIHELAGPLMAQDDLQKV